MSHTVCKCCGRAFADDWPQSERNPNVCVACFYGCSPEPSPSVSATGRWSPARPGPTATPSPAKVGPGSSVLPPPDWYKARLEALKKQPAPTPEEVETQFEASRKQRDGSSDEYEQMASDQDAKASPAVRNAKCTVCGYTFVDVMNGEDTCRRCSEEVA